MRAIQVTASDGPRSVQLVEMAEPVADDGQVIIDVHAAGVAFPDVLLSRGEYQLTPTLPFVPGGEVAGLVRSAPADAHVAAGQRVCALPMLGGFAERVAVAAHLVFPIPDDVSFTAAAALPINYLTVHFGLIRFWGVAAVH